MLASALEISKTLKRQSRRQNPAPQRWEAANSSRSCCHPNHGSSGAGVGAALGKSRERQDSHETVICSLVFSSWFSVPCLCAAGTVGSSPGFIWTSCVDLEAGG